MPGLTIERYYTKPNVNPYDTVQYEKRDCVISNPDGSVVFEMRGAEVPASWSQLASDILISKYFRKSGLYCDASRGETSIKQVVERIVGAIVASAETQGNYFEDAKSADTFADELTYMLLHQIGAFNSPVWFNCGLSRYDIKGQGGNWAWFNDYNIAGVYEVTDAYSRPQCSACFIQSVPDDLMGIYDLAKNEARLFKHGSGTGSNMSKLRSKYEKLSGGGTSSGLMSFLDMLDRVAGSTKSGGTTRRAAVMRCLDMDHPEIEDFINWKVKEEDKAKLLIAGGMDSDYNGEAYKTVSGQNSNNSVRVSDKFMKAVADKNVWHLTARTKVELNDGIIKGCDANDLWNQIANAAWKCADPGVQFDDTINKWHTCKQSGRINASNPCSEFMFLDDTACNLASINLTKFLKPNQAQEFDVNGFQHACNIFLIAQEILVDLSSYPTKSIAQNSHDYRPLGLGYCNLGSMLMRLGIPYDSDYGRFYAGRITSIMGAQAYLTSASIAAHKGPFEGYEKNKESMLEVIRNHRNCTPRHTLVHDSATPLTGRDNARAYNMWQAALQCGEAFGFRNSQVTVLAPTGTIGLLMDCDTTGVEPDFSLVKYKKLAGGGTVKIVNQSVAPALNRLGYPGNERDKIVEWIELYNTFEGAPYLKQEHYPIFDCANKCGANGKRFIAPLAHLKMMAAVQPFLSGAISKTVNLPSTATVEDVQEMYTEGYKLGLKSVALYRDGCKSSQPLNSKQDTDTPREYEEAKTVEVVKTPSGRHKLPKKRKGFTQECRIGGHKVFLRTGEYDDGTLGEIFLDLHKEGASFRSLANCFAMAVSLGLQYGVSLETFVKHFTFTRFDPQGPVEGHANIKMSTSIVDYVFRVLAFEYLQNYDLVHIKPNTERQPADPEYKEDYTDITKRVNTYIANNNLAPMQSDAPICNVCGHTTVRNAACYRCLNCGNSMGCS